MYLVDRIFIVMYVDRYGSSVESVWNTNELAQAAVTFHARKREMQDKPERFYVLTRLLNVTSNV